ncbi:hypothetical protein MKZ17_20370 [Solibacillus sp. FSL R7-0682]|uniref:hypothetical protein n=1 Tax=Solibacillus sp. FSL R7-0682 TaxID=2921690 RepID=UPI0030F6E347
MNNNKNSKLEKWRKDYAALAVAIGCLYSLIVSWGDNLFMSVLLSLGVIICGTIGFFDLKRILKRAL